MKKLFIVLCVVVGVICVLFLAKDIIIKASVEKGVELVTGLKLNIGSLNVGILKPIADVKNLVLLNPPEFPDRAMIDMPEIYVNYDLPAIIGGKIHLPEVRLALKEFSVIKNAEGKLNLDSLRSVQAQKEGKPPSQGAPGKAPEIRIDVLMLSIGKVIYKDYSKGGEPGVKEFNINLNEKYTNIDDPYKLASLIVVKALMHTSIASLANIDLQGLQGSVGEALAGAQKMTSEAVATAQKTAAATQEAVKDTVAQTSKTVKGALKNPFDSGK